MISNATTSKTHGAACARAEGIKDIEFFLVLKYKLYISLTLHLSVMGSKQSGSEVRPLFFVTLKVKALYCFVPHYY